MTRCRECGEPFQGLPHWHTCSRCWKPPSSPWANREPRFPRSAGPGPAARLEQLPGQLSLLDEPTGNVVPLRRRAA